MNGMRKLRRRGRGKQYEVEPLRPQQSFHASKMSEVILDFAEPLLNTIDDDDELFEDAISFAVICWNASFLPEKERKKIVCSMVDEMAKSDVLLRLGVQGDIRMLLEQFNAQFAHFPDDAPACDVCGSITVRNGSCYKCFNCGNSMGCS